MSIGREHAVRVQSTSAWPRRATQAFDRAETPRDDQNEAVPGRGARVSVLGQCRMPFTLIVAGRMHVPWLSQWCRAHLALAEQAPTSATGQ